MREWVLYVAVMAAVFIIFFRDRNLYGALAGLLISGPLYLALGFVLAKFGYQRKTIREMRAERLATTASSSPDTPGQRAANRPRPAPTKRTAGGRTNRPRRR